MSLIKYLLALFIPICGFVGLYYQSWWTLGSFYLGFVVIPVLEFYLPLDIVNDSEQIKQKKAANQLYDYLLYLNLPVLFMLIMTLMLVLKGSNLTPGIIIMLVINIGICTGVMGINVAHELGHRPNFINQLFAQILLIPALYMHFTISHNIWHHKYAATPKDPSTARLNENIFHFWVRSISGVWLNAIRLEYKRLNLENLPFIHWRNCLIWQFLIQLTYIMICYTIAGMLGVLVALSVALVAILLLESINYIEHYGLLRQVIKDQQYERVHEKHAWNSDHILGRIFLYELTRHPHHHEKADIKYQNLTSDPNSPQLPLGYPASILLALMPPLWFRYMNPRIEVKNFKVL